jgi:hypothetical protein
MEITLVQKIATKIFMCASIAFGILGIMATVIQPEDGGILTFVCA